MANRHLLAMEFFNRAEEFAKAYNDLPSGQHLTGYAISFFAMRWNLF
jgi:hypothetical protein